ncbi:HEAT repeat domain-containing protein [Frigoriglobus tundricola]|uniref:HEAT repeat domain-containing protein n=1 Tax=Frigoriglobus tundricola TaxID=2774151 RepID=A0A6M5YH84_9BACT|nr:HEAT repeat domain-containing protein [Frigoriglobus tundricola]QJW93415.1 hypothetical protein FTUN_0921 [Frigoriglobus tundricola]
MLRIRLTVALLLAALVVPMVLAGPGLFGNKPKPDAARVRTLAETLKSDPDEKKRKAAATELGWADARIIPDVVPALAAALQKDASAAVRAEAADALCQLNQMVPQAGVALEGAAADDPALAVRLAAKKALWQYHLNGYRSPKGSDGLAMQTIEPPIASPVGPTGIRPAVVFTPAPPPPVYVAPPPVDVPSPIALPPILPTGPRVVRRSFFGDLLSLVRPPGSSRAGAIPVPTVEPPIAKPAAVSLRPFPASTAPHPKPTLPLVAPPVPVDPPVPEYVSTLPPFKPDLPSIVLPPDAEVPGPALTPPKIPPTLPPSRR